MSTLKEICKEQTEMIDEMRQNIRELTKESDQYKAEREKFEQMLNEECERGYQMEGKYRDMKTQRDTLIDDIAVLKTNISRLEQIREMKESAFKGASNKIKRLEHRNKDLSVQFNEYIDETYEYLKLLSEFSQHIGNKPSSSTYKYFRAKLDGIGIKEGE